jgi:hypothetical protein
MKNVRLMFVICSLPVLVTGCTTGYQNINSFPGLGGYTDELISEGVYKITYLVNANTSSLKAKEFWLRRATELCGSSDYSHDMKLSIKMNQNSGYAGGMVYSSQHEFPLAEGIVKCKALEPTN